MLKEKETPSSKLKILRIQQGMTQKELSNISGVNLKSIASYEQSDMALINASVRSIVCLADCLGCEVEDLINRQYIERK